MCVSFARGFRRRKSFDCWCTGKTRKEKRGMKKKADVLPQPDDDVRACSIHKDTPLTTRHKHSPKHYFTTLYPAVIALFCPTTRLSRLSFRSTPLLLAYFDAYSPMMLRVGRSPTVLLPPTVLFILHLFPVTQAGQCVFRQVCTSDACLFCIC